MPAITDRYDAQAAAGAFLENELRYVLQRAYEKKYPEYHYARTIPVSFEVPEGAETFKYDLWDRVGDFDLVSDGGDDLATSDVKRGEVVQSVRQFGGGFRYTTDEIRKAQFAKQPLEQMKANAARAAYEERCHKTALFGRAGTGMKGFYNHNAVDRLVVTGTATDGWFDAPSITGLQMVQLLLLGVNYQRETTKMIETPNTIQLAFSDYQKIATTPIGTASDTTALEYFRRVCMNADGTQMITNIEAINELDPANSFGNLSAKRMVIYRRDPEKVKFQISMSLKFLPPQAKNLAFLVPAEAKIAGVQLTYPKSVTYVDKG
jgi:hypothetical protein